MNNWKVNPKICKCGARYLNEEEWTALPFSFLSFDGRVTAEARLCAGVVARALKLEIASMRIAAEQNMKDEPHGDIFRKGGEVLRKLREVPRG